MASLTIAFTPPSPAPSNGYRVKYRKVGTTSWNTVSPYPTSSPVIITGLENGVSYETTIESSCDAGVFSPLIAITAPNTKSFVSCGASLSNNYTGNAYYQYPSIYIDTFSSGISALNVSWNAVDRPNRFTLYDEQGNLVATTGWKGTASYTGPWGTSLSTPTNGVLTVTKSPTSTYYRLMVEAGPANTSSPVNDTWDAIIGCSYGGT
jgi:hypothetical protein